MSFKYLDELQLQLSLALLVKLVPESSHLSLWKGSRDNAQALQDAARALENEVNLALQDRNVEPHKGLKSKVQAKTDAVFSNLCSK